MKIILTERQVEMIVKEAVPLSDKEIARRLKLAKKHADKFPNTRQFALKYPKLWNFLRSQGLVDEVFPNRKQYHPAGYWTPETIGQEAIKYNSKLEFMRANQMAFKKAVEFGILNTLFPVDMRINNPGRPTSMSLEDAIDLAKEFQGSRTDFYKAHPVAYRLIRNNNLSAKYFGDDARKKNVSDQDLIDAAKKYDNIVDLKKNDAHLFSILRSRNLLIGLFNNDYKTEKIMQYAKQFSSRFDLKRNNKRMYLKLMDMNLLDKAFPPENNLSLSDIAKDIDNPDGF